MKTFIGNPYNEEYESDSDELGDVSRDTFIDNAIEDEWASIEGELDTTQDVNNEGWNSEDGLNNVYLEIQNLIDSEQNGEFSDFEDDSETDDDEDIDYVTYSDNENEDNVNPQEPENN